MVRFKHLGDWSLNNNGSNIGHGKFVNKSQVAADHMKKGDKITYIKVKDVWSNKKRIVIKEVN